MTSILSASLRRAVGLVVFLSVSSVLTAAQTYPTRPITIIVPYPPGGSTDLVARSTQDSISASLGQPVIIENRAGIGGTVGSAAVARAAPDGYTLLLSVQPPMTMGMYTKKDFPYDPLTAFAPISLAGETLLVLAINASLPANNVAELVDHVRKNPGKLSYGSAGYGSGHHIAAEMLKKQTGIDMTHVPYRGQGPLVQDLVAGHIQIGWGDPPSFLPHVAAGKVRILAVADNKRHPDFPNWPTVEETVPGVYMFTWLAWWAPAGTPRPIIDTLNAAANKAVRVPETVARLKAVAVTLRGSAPEEVAQRVKTEYSLWGKIIPAIGIQPE